MRSYLTGLATNYLNLFTRMIAGLIIVPLLFHSVGTELAGIYFLLISISNFVSIGIAWLSHAGTKLLADAAVQSGGEAPNGVSARAVHQVILQGFIGYSLLVGVVLLIGAACGGHLWGTDLSSDELSQARWAVVLVACFIFITFTNCAHVALLNATLRQHQANVRAIVSQLLFLGFVLIGLKFYPRIDVAMLAQVLGTLIPTVGLSIFLYRRGEILWPSFRINDRALFHKLVLAFGGRYFLYGIGEFLLMYVDLFLIGYLLGPTAVAAYTAVVKLPEFAAMLLGRITEIAIPYLSRIDAAGDKSRLAEGYLNIGRLQNIFGVSAGIIFAFLGHDFVKIWIGQSMTPIDPWLYVLAGIALAIRLSYRHDLVLFYSMGKVGRLVIPNLIELGVRFVAVILLYNYLGIGAALLSYCIVSGGIMLWVYHSRALRVLNLTWRSYLVRIGIPVFVVFAIQTLAGLLLQYFEVLNLPQSKTTAILIIILALLVMAVVGLASAFIVEKIQQLKTIYAFRNLVSDRTVPEGTLCQ